jgi:hypothetical protein
MYRIWKLSVSPSTWGAVALATLTTLVPAGAEQAALSRAEYEAWDGAMRWPFLADEVTLGCDETSMPYYEVDAGRFALNGKAQRLYPKGLEQQRPDPDLESFGGDFVIPIPPDIIAHGLALCP